MFLYDNFDEFFVMNGCWILSNSFSLSIHMIMDFLGGSDSKESAWSVEDLGLIPGLGRSPGEGNGYPLQYSGLENFMDRGAWQATVHGIAKSQTWMNNFHFTSLSFCNVLHHIDLHILNYICMSGINPTWPRCLILFIYYWIWFVRIFTSIFNRDIGL